jgi:hypothetical protein
MKNLIRITCLEIYFLLLNEKHMWLEKRGTYIDDQYMVGDAIADQLYGTGHYWWAKALLEWQYSRATGKVITK